MKLTNIYRQLIEEIDPKANATANSLLLMQKLKTNGQFMKMLSQISLPSDKYKAILLFADLLGVPEERFDDFMQNVKVQDQNEVTEETEKFDKKYICKDVAGNQYVIYAKDSAEAKEKASKKSKGSKIWSAELINQNKR